MLVWPTIRMGMRTATDKNASKAEKDYGNLLRVFCIFFIYKTFQEKINLNYTLYTYVFLYNKCYVYFSTSYVYIT